jgi:hypothetical protein
VTVRQELRGYQDGEQNGLVYLPLDDVRVSETLRGLLPDSGLIPIISGNMRSVGFDRAHPIVLGFWPGPEFPVVVDGHTRLRAAREAGLKEVPVVIQPFESEAAAIEYAIWNQGQRRSWTDAGIFTGLQVYHRSKKPGPKSNLAGPQAKSSSGKAADGTAKLFGVGRDKIERALRVLRNPDEHLKAAVATGKMSINKAFNEILRREREDRSGSKVATQQTVDEARAEVIAEFPCGNIGATVSIQIHYLASMPQEKLQKLHAMLRYLKQELGE